MSLIKCPECGNNVSDEAKACPNCGHPIQPKIKKRPKWVILLAVICGIIALLVCISAFFDLKQATSVGKVAKQADASVESGTEKKDDDVSSENKTKEAKEVQDPKVSFITCTDEELTTLPDLDGFVSSAVAVAKSIGVTDIVNTELGNYEENSGIFNISAKCETETGAELIIDSMYVIGYTTSEWNTFSIIDYYTGNYYFVSDDLSPFVDLYDYKTGKLISIKSKNLEDYDAEGEYNKRIEEANEEFQKSLNEIAEKYTNSNTKNDNTNEVLPNNIYMKSFSEDIEIINEYKWDNYGLNYLALELKNNSDFALRLDSEFIFYDENNNIIGTKKKDYRAFESESNILLYIANEEPFDHYECNLNPKEDSTFKPIQSKLKSDVSETDSKLIFSITNTGDSDILYVKCVVLFLLESEPVFLTHSYVGTSNGKILPSSTERAEIPKPYNIPYDEYILFLDGRG